jgi:hypothetical protein
MRWLVAFLAVLHFLTPLMGQTLQSTFTSDLEGWTSSSGGFVTYSSVGGNPGGFLRQQDLDLADMFISAPSLFLGNQTVFLGGSLSFDVKQLVGIADYQPFGIVSLRSGTSVNIADIVPPGLPQSEWTTQSIVLNAASFGTSAANFALILGNLTGLEVTLESQVGIVETVGFDNFRMSIATVPEPTALSIVGLLSVGLGLWHQRRRFRCWLVRWRRQLA